MCPPVCPSTMTPNHRSIVRLSLLSPSALLSTPSPFCRLPSPLPTDNNGGAASRWHSLLSSPLYVLLPITYRYTADPAWTDERAREGDIMKGKGWGGSRGQRGVRTGAGHRSTVKAVCSAPQWYRSTSNGIGRVPLTLPGVASSTSTLQDGALPRPCTVQRAHFTPCISTPPACITP